MKRLILSSATVATFLFSAASPAFANVIRADSQTTGKPVAVQSNTGSAQALANRSATGTTNKFKHDGTRPIVV